MTLQKVVKNVESSLNLFRFILYTIDRWHFGPDNTGNIFSRANLDALVDKLAKQGGAHLITAGKLKQCDQLKSILVFFQEHNKKQFAFTVEI